MPRSWRSRARRPTAMSISGSITSGDLGGLLAARTQVINPALNQLGQIATAVAQTVNSQQADGSGFERPARRRDFSHVGAPVATASSAEHRRHDGERQRDRTSGALTADNYVLSYNGGRVHADRCHDGGQRGAHGRGHGRQSADGADGPVDRAVGNSGGGRSVPDSADGARRPRPSRWC